jgi:hypothetical protein
MSRVRHVTPGPTAARIEKIRTLITALQIKSLTRGEMSGVLQMGPSGVRKYLVDLAGKYEWAPDADEDVCRLTICEAEARAFLASMAASEDCLEHRHPGSGAPLPHHAGRRALHDQAIARHPCARAGARRVLWSHADGDAGMKRYSSKRCVVCKSPEDQPHAPGCWVAQYTIRRVA